MTRGTVRSLLAEAQARPPAASDPDIDGLKPSLVLEPASAKAASATLSFCQRERLAVVPCGGGTRLHVGNLPSRLDCYLRSVHLSGVVSYRPGDLTVSVEAGTPFRELQSALAEGKQFIPWDPPDADRATVGGILAAGEPGFRRAPGARPRDLLLGFEALLADGTAVAAGGRVVKNVSGYELTKLLVGSRGTLAFLTRAHLRVRPLPETVLTTAASFESAQRLASGLSSLRSGVAPPEVVAVIDPTMAASLSLSGWVLLLRFEGIDEEASGDCSKAEALLRADEVTRLEGPRADEVWRRLRDFPSPASGSESECVVLGQVLASDTMRLAETWQSRGPVVAYPEAGRLYAKTNEPEGYLQLLETALDFAGNAVLESGPQTLKSQLDVFGVTPRGFELMSKIKEKMDPSHILSPGRFVGRL
jgi:glycolate oxidase FAD binding subunit